MIRVISSLTLLSIILASSLFAPAFSIMESERWSDAIRGNHVAPLSSDLGEGPQIVKFHGTDIDVNSIVSDFEVIKFEENQLRYNGNPNRMLVYGSNIDDLKTAAKDAYVYGLGGPSGVGQLGVAVTFSDSLSILPSSPGFSYLPDMPLEFDSVDPVSDPGRLSGYSIIRSDLAEESYNATGKGVKIAIVDTGTDFSSPDMQHAVARDSDGIPIMLDADGQGLVLSKSKFIASIDDRTGRIKNAYDEDSKLPEGIASYAYVNDTGHVFLRTAGITFPVYNTLYPFFGTPTLNATANVDWKIGNSPDDYIVSKSGIYRFGAIFQIQASLGSLTFALVPVLVVDSEESGVYDTVIADMSAAWYFFANDQAPRLIRDDLPSERSFDFTDETAIKLGEGKEFLIHDYDDDGFPDLSAGTVGARVLDIWNVIDEATEPTVADPEGYGGVVHAKLLKPLDPNGDYFGVMYDYAGHGTGTASTVSSAGVTGYSVYKDEEDSQYKLRGIAPDAQIIPVKALWAGDAIFGWLYASGFDIGILDGRWHYGYGDKHRADIISNSWGIASFPVLKHGQGYDILSMFSSLLAVPEVLAKDYPGIVMINSAGNNGLGYGSVGSPNVSPLGISVGATTNNVHIGYNGFNKLPRFGNSTESYDDVADFTSKGPGLLGDPKPELMAIGEYAFTPGIVNIKILQSTEKDSNPDAAFTLFGGTSMAAPMVAGVAALVIEEKREMSKDNGPIDPYEVKSILMSSAKDLKNDPFTQGSGRVDAKSAIDLVRGKTGSFSIYTEDTVKNILKAMEQDVIANEEIVGIVSTGVQDQTVADRLKNFTRTLDLKESRWFAGYIEQGESASTDIIVENPSNKEISVKLTPSTEKVIATYEIKNATRLFEIDPLHNSTEFGYAPNYFDLEKEIGAIPENAELMVARVNFPFSDFMNSTEYYAHGLRLASLYVYDWEDKNEDGGISYDETVMVNRGGSWGTVQETRISDPAERFAHTPLVGVYPVPDIFSFWAGDRQINSTSMNYTLTVEFYERKPYQSIILDGADADGNSVLTIGPKSSERVSAIVVTDGSAISGIYQASIVAEFNKEGYYTHQTIMPVSYVVTSKPVPKDVPIVFAAPKIPDDDQGGIGLRPNGYVGGLFDMTSRYPAGDWRSYYFSVKDNTITSMSLKVSWPHNSTSINAMVFSPDGKLVASSVPAGVFQALIGWPTNDWLGTSRFSEGGGFFFSQNNGDNSTVLFVPVNQTGIYSVLLHNTLFHGESLYEPVLVEAEFSTILPDGSPPILKVDIPEYISRSTRIPLTIDEENLIDYKYAVDKGLMLTPNSAVWIGQEFQKQTFDIILDGTNLEEGPHHISIISTDVVGFVSEEIFKFQVDRTAPAIDLQVIDNNEGIARIISKTSDLGVTKQSKILWNITDKNSVVLPVAVTLPNGTTIQSESTSFSLAAESLALEDGEYRFSIVTHDAAGNKATRNHRLVMDHTPPSVSFAIAGGLDNLKGQSLVIIDILEENLEKAMLVIDGEKSIDVTGMDDYQLDTTTLADGRHELKLIAVDSAGNSDEAVKAVSIVNTKSLVDAAQFTGIGIGLAAGLGVAVVVWIYTNKKKQHY